MLKEMDSNSRKSIRSDKDVTEENIAIAYKHIIYGSFSYSKEAEVTLKVCHQNCIVSELSNPFNPVTVISLAVPVSVNNIEGL